MRNVLVIAGVDLAGKSGIAADLRAFSHFGQTPSLTITAHVAQSSQCVHQIRARNAAELRRDLFYLFQTTNPRIIKIGMMPNRAVVETIAAAITHFRRHRKRIVILDPILNAGCGDALLDKEGCRAMKALLFPLVDVLTPNIPEAEQFTGLRIRNRHEMIRAGRHLLSAGPRCVIIKGGHAHGAPVDLFMMKNRVQFSSGREIRDRDGKLAAIRGTGCSYASALAAGLACGDSLIHASKRAQSYVKGLLRKAAER